MVDRQLEEWVEAEARRALARGELRDPKTPELLAQAEQRRRVLLAAAEQLGLMPPPQTGPRASTTVSKVTFRTRVGEALRIFFSRIRTWRSSSESRRTN